MQAKPPRERGTGAAMIQCSKSTGKGLKRGRQTQDFTSAHCPWGKQHLCYKEGSTL